MITSVNRDIIGLLRRGQTIANRQPINFDYMRWRSGILTVLVISAGSVIIEWRLWMESLEQDARSLLEKISSSCDAIRDWKLEGSERSSGEGIQQLENKSQNKWSRKRQVWGFKKGKTSPNLVTRKPVQIWKVARPIRAPGMQSTSNPKRMPERQSIAQPDTFPTRRREVCEQK